jgi:uncharacterized membrane protein YebE (DUF533 family)
MTAARSRESLKAALAAGFDESLRRFVETEIGHAADSIEMARGFQKDPAAAKHRQAARLVFDTLSAFLPHLQLTQFEQEQYEAKLGTLKTRLLELGEVFA